MVDLVALKDLLDGMVGDDRGFDEVEWAIKRIEKLERRLKHQNGVIANQGEILREGHHSTDEQIAAAVEMATKTFNGSYSTIGRWLLRMLETFGIFRCEGCATHGIFGIQGNTDPNTGEDMGPCPDCNGRGWVKK